MDLSSDGLVFGTHRACSTLCATICTKTGELSRFSIAYKGKSSSNKLLSLPDVFNHNSALAAWCLIPVQCMTSKSGLESHRRHRANPSVQSVRLRTHLKAL